MDRANSSNFSYDMQYVDQELREALRTIAVQDDQEWQKQENDQFDQDTEMAIQASLALLSEGCPSEGGAEYEEAGVDPDTRVCVSGQAARHAQTYMPYAEYPLFDGYAYGVASSGPAYGAASSGPAYGAAKFTPSSEAGFGMPSVDGQAVENVDEPPSLLDPEADDYELLQAIKKSKQAQLEGMRALQMAHEALGDFGAKGEDMMETDIIGDEIDAFLSLKTLTPDQVVEKLLAVKGTLTYNLIMLRVEQNTIYGMDPSFRGLLLDMFGPFLG